MPEPPASNSSPFSRHGRSPGCGKERVPFLAAQGDRKRLGTGPQSIRAGSSQHGLDLRRVFEKPGQQDGLGSDFVTLSVFLHQGGSLFYVLGLTVEFPHQDTLGQGTPGLEQNILHPAIFHGSLPTIGVAGRALVEGNADLGKAVVQQAHLHLVRHQGFGQKGLEVFHLEAVLVGNAEVAHLARKVEFPEGLGDFLPFPEGIGPVQ